MWARRRSPTSLPVTSISALRIPLILVVFGSIFWVPLAIGERSALPFGPDRIPPVRAAYYSEIIRAGIPRRARALAAAEATGYRL